MQQVSRSEAFFWCGHERSEADDRAATVRGKIAEIAETVEQCNRIRIGFPLSVEPGIDELRNALFVIQKLEDVLSEWPEYWDEEYLAEMAKED